LHYNKEYKKLEGQPIPQTLDFGNLLLGNRAARGIIDKVYSRYVRVFLSGRMMPAAAQFTFGQ